MIELPLSIRAAARALVRRPVQPIIAALVLGVAVGVVGVTATAAYDTVLRPTPYRETDRLLVIRDATDLLSPSALETLRGARSFDAVSAYGERWLIVSSAFAVLLFVVASSLWPAVKALRVVPSIALKAD